ncbi:MAG: hypothetical protein HQL23_07490 [Candidatus Omnitrophica bacterium]|nr:hypothetical protein [Candidatus Omnitrophota bacterium]
MIKKSMKKISVFLLFSLMVIVTGCAADRPHYQARRNSYPYASAAQQARENRKFRCEGAVFNNQANTEIRDNKADEKEEAKNADSKKKKEEDRTKDEGQVKINF